MSKHAKHVAKHRHAPERAVAQTSRRVLRTTVVLSSVAVAATGVAVSGGVLASSAITVGSAAENVGANVSSPVVKDAVRDREPVVSRSSDRRKAADPIKESALSITEGPAVTRTVDVSQSDPREIAQSLLPQFGFSSDQFGCLDSLWTRECNWNISADNPSSSAYGIPQALPGSKMSSAGSDWATNPVTQITLGPGLHPGPLRQPLRRLVALRVQRLVLRGYAPADPLMVVEQAARLRHEAASGVSRPGEPRDDLGCLGCLGCLACLACLDTRVAASFLSRGATRPPAPIREFASSLAGA